MNHRQKTLKAVLFRSLHRGGKEADIILGGFAQQYADLLNDNELDSFADLLLHDDHKIMYWIEVLDAAPECFPRALLEKINKHALQSLNTPSL